MLLGQTIDKLQALGLPAMAEAMREQQGQPAMAELPFEERLGLLVDREWDARENRRLARRLKNARLKQTGACVEDVDFSVARGLDKSLWLSLAGCHWIASCQHLIISGPTGVGKTFLACALGNKACRLGHSVLFTRMSRLLDAVAAARADGSYASLTRKLAKTRLLVIDDWGLAPLDAEQAREVLDVLEDRNGSGSTLIVTQIPVREWHGRIGDPTVADAILDRLVHCSHRIELHGESMRRVRAPNLAGVLDQAAGA